VHFSFYIKKNAVLDKSNALASCDIAAEKLMAAVMKFRGNGKKKKKNKQRSLIILNPHFFKL